MKRTIILGAAVLALSACGSSEDKVPAPSPTPSASPTAVAFDPKLVDVAGTWQSPSNSLDDGRFLRVDVASGGRYSIDVRIAGTPEQVVETGSGKVAMGQGGIVATPDADTKGQILGKLGAWKASGSKTAKSLDLVGADGRRLKMEYKGL